MTAGHPTRASKNRDDHRLLYLCDWLPPDFGAVGQYAVQQARARAAAGERVTLVGLTSGTTSSVDEAAGLETLRIVRLRASTYDRGRFASRALWTVRTNLRLLWRARRDLVSADEILFTGSPPFLIHLLVPLNAFLRRRLTYRITDFHPECLIAERNGANFALQMLLRLTLAMRRHVERFEVLGEDQRSRLLEEGIPGERIVLKRDPAPVDLTAAVPMRRPSHLEGRCVLLYSGNFGVAHDDSTFLDGYRRHHRHGSGRVALWLNATGAKADRLEKILRTEGLPVHRTHPVPLDELASLLVTPDAHLITLRDAFVGYVLPSKVYGCIASGKPVLYIGSERSDVHLLCAEGLSPHRYQRISVGDAPGVTAALELIADSAACSRHLSVNPVAAPERPEVARSKFGQGSAG